MSWYRNAFAAVLMVAGLCCGTYAADYPSKPIKIIVPYPAGGTTDIIARLISTKISERLGQPVIIDNRSGAGGSIGTAAAAKSAPDGYTLVFSNYGPMTVGPAVYRNFAYDPEKDLAPICNVTIVSGVIVVPAAVPVKSIPELIAYEKAQRGQLFYASVGVGSGSHIASEMFNMMAGTKFIHVPYKGGAPANIGTIAGEVTVYLATLVEALPHIESGKLRALAVTDAKRSQLKPDLPTVGESVPGFVLDSWFGILAPAGTPRPIIDLLYRTTAEVVELPDMRQRMLELGLIPALKPPEQLAATIKADLAKWAKVAKEAGITAE